jgi:hypothetical protein
LWKLWLAQAALRHRSISDEVDELDEPSRLNALIQLHSI